jgi:hypothetical protein
LLTFVGLFAEGEYSHQLAGGLTSEVN